MLTIFSIKTMTFELPFAMVRVGLCVSPECCGCHPTGCTVCRSLVKCCHLQFLKPLLWQLLHLEWWNLKASEQELQYGCLEPVCNGAHASRLRLMWVSVTLISHLFRCPGAQQASHIDDAGISACSLCYSIQRWQPLASKLCFGRAPACCRHWQPELPLSCLQAGQDMCHAWEYSSCSFLRS